MQNKDNITATECAKNLKSVGPQKMAKLRDKDTMAKNAEKIMQILEKKELETPVVEKNISVEIPKEDIKENVPIQEENNKEEIQLPFTSEEILKNKKDLLGIEAYKTLIGNIMAIKSIQETSRRLKTNPVVPGNINRERNINGIEMVVEPVKEEKSTFDFSSIPGVSKTEEIQEEKKYDNTKLDEWLNKENGISSSDPVLNEVSDLQSVRDNTAASLANQKEILARLRERIENNKVLCEAKKKELREENMELTQELNDVLAEINKLTDVANQQEAFLGISQDDNIGIVK